MSISKCMSVVGRLADADQNALLERIEKLQTEEGVGPNKAAVEVATEMLAELERQSFAEPVRSVRRDVTETDEFKEWFGGSKVVDADGKPLVVYHGTVVRPDTDRVKSMGDIKAFDRMFTTQFRRPSIDTVGSWFSTNPGEGGAEMYSGSGHGSAIYPVYLSIQNPQITTFQLMTRRARLLHNGKDDGRPIGAEEVAAYRKWLADTGKDGIKIEGSGNDGSTEFDKQDAWIALEPEQIKSATGNRGTFDPADPDITRSAARPEFFSQLQRAIEQVPDRLATMAAPQWKLWLDANASKLGVKKDEVEWSGVRDYLDLRGKEKVSRDELAAFLGDNGVRVEETVLGEDEGLTNEERTELSELRDLRRRHEGGERGVLDPSDVRRLRELEFRSTRPAGSTPKYSQYTVPGGDNYREVLITLPGDKPQQGWTASSMIDRKDELVDGDTVDDLAFNTAVAQVRESGGMSAASEALSKKISSTSGKKSHVSARNLINELIRQNAEIAKARSNQKPTYKSNHWDQPNILAHLRVDDRTDADGKRVLFINEIQSDWGQDGKKKGFRAGKPVIVAKKIGKSRWFPEQDEYDVTVDGETRPRMSGASESEVISRVAETLPAFAAAGGKSKVPSAPFVTDTKAWAGLALKRAIMMAVESGYDRVALITGQQAADLYDLSKRVSEIRYEKVDDKDLWEIEVDDSEGNQIMSEDEIPASRIEELVGKEIAQKIVAGDGEAFTPDSPRDWRRLTGLDLKVGGEGMRAFYDQIIPQVARDVLKKLGGDGLKKTTITEDPNVALDKWEAEDGEGDGSRAPTTESQNLAFDITPAMREKVAAGVPLFSKRRQDPIESAENFKRWSNNAPLITSAAADDHAFRTGQKVVLEAYHGTARGDRVGDVFQRSRATSGPMAFFTSDPELASSYATGKRDTSLSDEELQYTGWFKYKAPGMRSSVSIDRAWSLLPNDVRERIAQRMPDIRTDDNDQIVYEEGGGDIGSYEWNLQQTRRGYLGANPLAAAAETWLNSGTLFGEEERFMEVLRLAGMPMGDTQYDSPNDSFPFVYKAFVFMQNPLATGDIPESFDQALRQAAAKDRSRARYENGVDSWDKNTRTLRAWADEYFNPASGDNRFVWTSIPDKVSDLIKSLGYDGIIDYSGKGGGTVHPVYIPTEENQVKSAIGNNGKYSTARSILRSAGRAARFHRDMDTVKLAGGYTLGDMMKSSKKVSWWDKSVGSMFNLAEKQPQFKRVYDEVQDFLGDISKYATRAADMAPTIIPKLETLSDIARRPLSVEDTKALSAPVFEGTLMYRRDEEGNPVRTDDVGAAGVVWREDELRTMYGLNDSQIALYRETRKSINKSLTDLSITDMLRYAGKDADGVRSAVLSSTTANQAAQILAQEFERLAEQTPERRSALEDSARGVKEKANLTQGLIAKGYAPLSRYGDYTVYVTKDGGAEQVFFGMYETEREANKAARAWRDAEPDAQVATGTMSKESYKLFKGVTPETLALFGESLGLEEGASDRDSQVFQAYLKAAKTNRSAMKRMIERKGVAGYSEDVGRVLAGFVYSNARQASTNLHAGQIAKAAADIKDGDLKDQAIKLVEYTQTPKNEANALRGLMFANFIGGSIASALVNTTQTATTTLPALAMHFGTAKAASGLAKAIDNVRKGGGSDDLKEAMKRAEAEGITAPQEVHHLMAQAAGRSSLSAGDGTKVGNAIAKIGNAKNKAMLAWGSLFGWAEQLNRKIAFAAGYQMAKDGGISDPFDFARKLVAQTQFTMNAGNNPVWARGAVGATLFTFKKFGFAYLELLARMLGNGPEGKRAFALALGVLFLLAGTGGFPFAEDLDDLIDGFAQRVLNKSFSSKAAKKEFFASVFGNDLGDFLEGGLSSLPGAPIDVSGRLGLGNIIPGTGVLTVKQDYSRDVAEVGGAAATFVQNWLKAAGMVAKGDVANAASTAAPLALSNVAKAIDMANMGMYRDQRGRKVIDTTMAEAVLKGIGFQPATVKKVQEASGIQQSLIAQNKIRETEIADLWAKGRIERRPELVEEAKRQVTEWNESNPQSRISIDPNQINRRVQQAMQDKAKRIEKTAPKEIRAAVKEQLEAAR